MSSSSTGWPTTRSPRPRSWSLWTVPATCSRSRAHPTRSKSMRSIGASTISPARRETAMRFSEPLFDDRYDAGQRLAAALGVYRDENPMVLALPRGGVPVGFEAARALQAPLDVLLVRKIGAPGQPELGLGAVVDGSDPQ